MCHKLLHRCVVLIALSCSNIITHAEYYPECAGEDKFQTFVASRSNCANYIFCDGEDSWIGHCLADNYFNQRAEQCDDPDEVECNLIMGTENASGIDNGNHHPINETDTNEANGVENWNHHESSDGSIAQIGSNNWNSIHQVINSVGGSIWNSVISTSDNFNSNQRPNTINPVSTSALPTPITPIINYAQLGIVCPLVLSTANQYMQYADPNSCSAFYICYNGISIPMLCPAGMYFNVRDAKCAPQYQVYCPLRSTAARLDCRQGIYDYIPHPTKCEYYYYCSNGFLLILECPHQYTWHYEHRTCVHKSQSKCFTQQRMLQVMSSNLKRTDIPHKPERQKIDKDDIRKGRDWSV